MSLRVAAYSPLLRPVLAPGGSIERGALHSVNSCVRIAVITRCVLLAAYNLLTPAVRHARLQLRGAAVAFGTVRPPYKRPPGRRGAPPRSAQRTRQTAGAIGIYTRSGEL